MGSSDERSKENFSFVETLPSRPFAQSPTAHLRMLLLGQSWRWRIKEMGPPQVNKSASYPKTGHIFRSNSFAKQTQTEVMEGLVAPNLPRVVRLSLFGYSFLF